MAEQKTVHLEYFAAFREMAGKGSETVRSQASTATELYEEVAALHGFAFDRSTLRVALNNVIEPWSSPIRDGDLVTFLAPFAGG